MNNLFHWDGQTYAPTDLAIKLATLALTEDTRAEQQSLQLNHEVTYCIPGGAAGTVVVGDVDEDSHDMPDHDTDLVAQTLTLWFHLYLKQI